ncbi:hypothetical protein B0H14DRAFT_2606510 [Mycena olivaceomarginata]|nr:hypothetical protein B0H14DRAFT_2606510 [Mycena olivaceomarginata]
MNKQRPYTAFKGPLDSVCLIVLVFGLVRKSLREEATLLAPKTPEARKQSANLSSNARQWWKLDRDPGKTIHNIIQRQSVPGIQDPGRREDAKASKPASIGVPRRTRADFEANDMMEERKRKRQTVLEIPSHCHTDAHPTGLVLPLFLFLFARSLIVSLAHEVPASLAHYKPQLHAASTSADLAHDRPTHPVNKELRLDRRRGWGGAAWVLIPLTLERRPHGWLSWARVGCDTTSASSGGGGDQASYVSLADARKRRGTGGHLTASLGFVVVYTPAGKPFRCDPDEQLDCGARSQRSLGAFADASADERDDRLRADCDFATDDRTSRAVPTRAGWSARGWDVKSPDAPIPGVRLCLGAFAGASLPERAVGHRIVYGAAVQAKVDGCVLDIWKKTAVEVIYPRLEEFLSQMDVEAYITAPFMSEEKWNVFWILSKLLDQWTVHHSRLEWWNIERSVIEMVWRLKSATKPQPEMNDNTAHVRGRGSIMKERIAFSAATLARIYKPQTVRTCSGFPGKQTGIAFTASVADAPLQITASQITRAERHFHTHSFWSLKARRHSERQLYHRQSPKEKQLHRCPYAVVWREKHAHLAQFRIAVLVGEGPRHCGRARTRNWVESKTKQNTTRDGGLGNCVKFNLKESLQPHPSIYFSFLNFKISSTIKSLLTVVKAKRPAGDLAHLSLEQTNS